MTSTEQFVYDTPLADSMKVVLGMNLPGYVYGRCYKHDIIATPDPDNTIRATGKIACTNQGCTATTVLIPDPVAYLQERCLPNLTVEGVLDVLKEEGFKIRDFLRYDNCRPKSLGRVTIVREEHHDQTKHELAHEKVVVRLPDHDLYIEFSGVKDYPDDKRTKKRWEYEVRAVKPQKRKVEAIPAQTVTDFISA